MTTKTAPLHGRVWGARAQDWADIQEGQSRPLYAAVFDRVGINSGMRYLDAGCGAGMAAELAARRGAQVSGLDAAEGLLQIARFRVPSGDFRGGELEELPFPDNSFDVVTGFNSFQYAADPSAALAQAKRVTRSGGTVVVVTWGNPAGMQAASLVGALKHLLPPPPPNAPGPLALSDETALRALAIEAGLEPMELADVPSPWYYPDLATALRGLNSSGQAVRAAENSSEEEVRNAQTTALAPFRQSDGSYRIGATFRYLLARA